MTKLQRRVFTIGEEAAWLADKIAGANQYGNDAAFCLRKYSELEKELHELKRAREGWKLVPIQLTEEMIQSACLKQSIEDYSSYNEWLESHSTGISESIRNYIISDYKAMLEASPKEPK